VDNPVVRRCFECGTEIAPELLACPGCSKLVHAKALKELAALAEEAERSGNLSEALGYWRQAASLLPPDSRQFGIIDQKLQSLRVQVEEASPGPQASAWKKGAAGLSGFALLLFKFKTFLLLILTKAKFILLGLTKAKVLFSMLLSVGYYCMFWGWKFALGLVVSIYIHEMGHLWKLTRYGIPADAPMFMPGFGAFVRFQKSSAMTVIEHSRVSLAGPMWGMAAAGVSYGLYLSTGDGIWGALAQAGGLLNLLNLIPVWIFDGNYGISSLTKGQRWLAFIATGVIAFGTAHEHRFNFLLPVIGLCLFVRALNDDAPKERDDYGLFQYVLLILLLGGLSAIDVPMKML
jgi:Zn-dependent protease